MTTTITLSNFVIPVDIGIYPHEIGALQPVRFDICATLNRTASQNDDISSTLDYDLIQEHVISLTQSKRYNLLETLCADIANSLIDNQHITKISVSAQKLNLKSNCEAIIVNHTQEC